jgi:hypothetical protein
MKNSRGSILALGGLMTAAVFAVALLVVDVGRFCVARRRAETLAQISVTGALRMRIEGLAHVAERWDGFGASLGPVDAAGRVFLSSSDTSAVESSALTLSRALSGYQGRAQSIVTVLAQSNNMARDRIVIERNDGSRLDIAAQPASVIDETGATRVVTALWYRRGWALTNATGDPSATEEHRAAFTFRPLLMAMEAWPSSALARGQLRWNASPGGNGGYPRAWSDAVDAARLRPNRTASYRAVITGPAS